MSGPVLTVATANVLGRLDRSAARAAVDTVLAADPDVVCLQEWYWRRRRGLLVDSTYRWFRPWFGGCAVGLRTERLDWQRGRSRVLSWPGWADRDGRGHREPGRTASVVVGVDRESGHRIGVVDYHLVSQVQARGLFRTDRPRLVARHHREVGRLTELVAELSTTVDVVVAAGDSNLDGFRIPGLRSTWEGRETHRGTHGQRRKIDDVHASVPVFDARLLETPSDHRAVVVGLDLSAG